MCGIFCHISQTTEGSLKASTEWEECLSLITARGPDKSGEKFESLGNNWLGHFAGSVLWMQGAEPVGQPAVDGCGNILLWNGDIFSGPLVDDTASDTNVVLNAFQTSPDILSVLGIIQGPYSFIYYQKSTNLLYFGRDKIGRHSLLLKSDTSNNSITITSVANKNMKGTIELPAIGIFIINLIGPKLHLSCSPWKRPDDKFNETVALLEKSLSVEIDIEDSMLPSVKMLPSVPLEPQVKDLEYLENSIVNGMQYQTLQKLLENDEVKKRVNDLLELLQKATAVRIKKMPELCKNCIETVLRDGEAVCTHTKIGILFSGGLDSAILALLADQYVPRTDPIDLINVAFEKVSNTSAKSAGNNTTAMGRYDVPDRITGRQTLAELTQICPTRQWNFVQVNVSQEELHKYRSCRIGDLLYPLCTILDESLGCAVWFASRAKGFISSPSDEYQSPCRVILLGMGADELFGGYMRHRTLLRHKGWEALTEELSLELERISERNLGRDDRIISDVGRQGRFPYLDEAVIKFVQQLKPWEKCYPTNNMPSGLGDKLLLRLLACRLGLRNTANFPKRAFQFGSRIANSKENARDISNRL